ncbi:hypothetical protein C8R48DRAFT_605602 [Suillus tomentosus]|nr:hypothetical protein C8R48DRAFT_605602 [Suillus tomentosus]
MDSVQRPSLAQPQRDFALRGAGAEIIEQLTSSTHQLPAKTVRSWFSEALLGWDLSYSSINPPTVVIDGDLSIGNCWSFLGSTGSLAMRFSEKIYIANITIYHVASNLIAKMDVQKAPRQIILWGILDSPEHVESAVRHNNASTFLCRASCLAVGTQHNCRVAHPPLFRLANIMYDLHSREHIQYSEVDSAIYADHDHLSFQQILLEIQDNWGADSTCIYGVSIHGVEVIRT